MRLALLWALGLLGAGSPLPSWPLPNIGGTEEQQAESEKALREPLEPQVLQDDLPISLKKVLQTSLPEPLRIKLELDGDSHILELLQNRELVSGRPTLVWYQPDGTRVVSEGHTLENCCYQGRVQGYAGSWVSVCTCSGLRGLVVLTAERSYTLEQGPGDLQGPPIISRIQDLHLPGHTCALSWREFVHTQTPPEHPLGQRHIRRRRDVVTETKTVELVIVADHSEVQKYRDFQHLLNRTLEVALLLDTFFRPLNVRVALVGLEAWTQRDLVEISPNPAVTLENFLHWRRAHLLPRLPHDSAQLVTGTSFSGPTVGMAIQNSICSPDFSGGVNMDHSTSILGVASSIAHELGHSLGLDHDLPGNSCPCPGPAPAKTCIMEASTDFLPGLNFSNCSRRALEKALLDGMGSCLFERLPSRPPMAAFCGNMFVEPGEQCDCGFPDDCVDPCCDSSTCQLRPFAQCASDGPCCQNCQVCDSNRHCYCEEGWAPPDCTTQLKAISSLTTGLLLSLLVLLVLVMLGASYWYRARLHQRLCQLKGPTCQYRAAQSGLPERPGPPQRALLARGTKQASALSFPAPPSRPLPPDPVSKRLQSQGPAKPPPPRKPLPADPQGQCPSGDLPGPGAGIPPLVVPSRPAPPPPTVSSLYL
uniref:ADAM metallopeptidase domain 15 n=1 Tax=Nomascus leucogenys TaxID=61853 RepID=A0A2I3FYZ3_NOMLE